MYVQVLLTINFLKDNQHYLLYLLKETNPNLQERVILILRTLADPMFTREKILRPYSLYWICHM